jgi:hypothetical protein
MKDYEVINPTIGGSLKTIYSAESVNDAAKEFWSTVGSNFMNTVPSFTFTMQEKHNPSKINSFKVKETVVNGEAKFNIDKVDHNSSKLKEFLTERNKIVSQMTVQSGGKKTKKRYNDDDDDSSSSSDDDLDEYFSKMKIRNWKKPIVYWWHSPSIYYESNYFTPTFVSPLSPYVQTWYPA